jgi:hypothetical protein
MTRRYFYRFSQKKHFSDLPRFKKNKKNTLFQRILKKIHNLYKELI